MKINISVSAENDYGLYSRFAVIVPEPYAMAFKRLRITDDPFLAIYTGEYMESSNTVQRTIELRKEAAREIADALTKGLLEQMAKNDTRNGYSN